MKNKRQYVFNILHTYPRIVWIAMIGSGVLMFQILIGVISVYPIMEISPEALFQAMATSAEVIAGLYGITLAGYIFFLDHLQEKVEKNPLLSDVVTLLKQRYHKMVLLLSGNTVLVIFSTLGLIVYGPENFFLPEVIYRFWVYETLFLIFTDVLLIIYFIVTVVDPDKISRISSQYKKKMSGVNGELGDLQTFLSDYDEIEHILVEYSERQATKYMMQNPIKSMRSLNSVEIRKWINDILVRKLIKISQYYSYMVFSQEMTVSKEMYEMTREVKTELEQLLNPNIQNEGEE